MDVDTALLRKLLGTNPKELAALQEVELRQHAVQRVRALADALDRGAYDEAMAMHAFSPAGDSYGSENYYLDFDDLINKDGTTCLGAIIEHLQRLAQLKQEK